MRDPLPSLGELSPSDIESLAMVYLEHQVACATWISKETTKADLHVVGISLVGHHPSSSRVIMFYHSFLQITLFHARLMCFHFRLNKRIREKALAIPLKIRGRGRSTIPQGARRGRQRTIRKIALTP